MIITKTLLNHWTTNCVVQPKKKTGLVSVVHRLQQPCNFSRPIRRKRNELNKEIQQRRFHSTKWQMVIILWPCHADQIRLLDPSLLTPDSNGFTIWVGYGNVSASWVSYNLHFPQERIISSRVLVLAPHSKKHIHFRILNTEMDLTI